MPLFENEKNVAPTGTDTNNVIEKNLQRVPSTTPRTVDMQGAGAGSPPSGTGGNQVNEAMKGKGEGPGSIPGKKSQRPGFPVTTRDLLGGSSGISAGAGSGSGDSVGGRLNFDSGFSPNLSFETKDFNWSDYANALYLAIWRSWHNRLYLTLSNFERWSIERNSTSIDGVTGVSFVIERNGDISEISLLYSSSIEPLDISAIDALREAVLPPLPVNFPKQGERVTARFIAETDVKAMKQWLPIYKYYGYF